MRLSGLLFGTFLMSCLNPMYSYAQQGEQPEVYQKHHDTRHGHDHVYPDRGAVMRDLPRGTIGINYADVSYRYHDGVWLEPRGPVFRVVAPPIGIVVPTLPMFSTILAYGGETYIYANDAYYRPRPDLGGYEVVNAPAEGVPPTEPETLVGGQLPGAAPATTAAATKLTTPSAMIATGKPTVAPGTATTAPVPAQAAAVLPSAAAETTSSMVAAPVPVTLPTGPPASTSAPASGSKVFPGPKNGQTPDQQARDRDECYRYAVAQSGFDPTHSTDAASAAPSDGPQSDYKRAQSACLEGLGYVSR
jgi:hypothetical protein